MIKLGKYGDSLEVDGYFEPGVMITRIDKIKHLRSSKSCILSSKFEIGFGPVPQLDTWDKFEEFFRYRLNILRRYFSFATLKGFCSAMGLNYNSISHLFKNEPDRITCVIPGILDRKTKYIDLVVIPELILLGLKRKATKVPEERRKIYREMITLIGTAPGVLLENKKILSDVLSNKIRLGIPPSWRLGKCLRRDGIFEFAKLGGFVPSKAWMRAKIRNKVLIRTPLFPAEYSAFQEANQSQN